MHNLQLTHKTAPTKIRLFYRNIGLSVFLLCLICLLLSSTAIAGSNGSGDGTTSVDIGDPINAATRSYYFPVSLLDLGGTLPVRYGLIYQSNTNFLAGFQPVIPYIWRTNIYSTYILH